MAAVPAIMAVAAAGASIYSGISQYQAAGQQAKLQREQGALAAQNASDNAAIQATQVRQYAAKQKLQFLANGVDFSGSAILAVNESLNEGQKQVNATARQGSAEAKLAYETADVTTNQGRAALIGGFGQAGSQIESTPSQAAFKNAGWTQ